MPAVHADVILIVDTAFDVIANDGACSLREAITAANNNANYFGCIGNGGGFDLIEFSIGVGTPVIHIASGLPTITGPLEINGGPNRVELRGPGSGTGLRISGAGAAGSSVRNLVLNNFTSAVSVETTSNVSIVGNYIGTNAAGSAPASNGNGIVLYRAIAQIGGPNGWTSGGSCTGDCNLISGNTTWGVEAVDGSNATVRGNMIGTNASGTSPIGNYRGIRVDNSIVVIGGTALGSGNLISGNANGEGISIRRTTDLATGSFVQGNRIGTNSSGGAAIPNGTGIAVNLENRAHPVTIGGSMTGAGNLISGNTGAGIFLVGADGVSIFRNLIGTRADGVSPLPNGGSGIQLSSSTHDNIIGSTGTGPGTQLGNVIAYNATGVSIGIFDYYNEVRGNSIRDNVGKGISLADNQNDTASTPAITGLAPLSGTACPNCMVDLYSDLADEGDTYEGTALANAAGQWSFNGSVTGPNVTAVATSLVGSSSEFSAAVPEPGLAAGLAAGGAALVALRRRRPLACPHCGGFAGDAAGNSPEVPPLPMGRRSRLSMALASMFAVSVATSTAEAATIRDDVDDALYVALGDSYPSVGFLAGNDGSRGSAVLLSNNWILTAAHVVTTGDWSGTLYINGPTGYTITGVIIHPDYNPRTLDFDYALAFIPEGVQGVPSSPYYDGAIDVGLTVTSIGWGDHGTGLTGAIGFDGSKRGFQNIVDQVSERLVIFDFDDPAGTSNVTGSPIPLPLEGITAYGDSGGGLFADFGAGPWLIAITTSGTTYDSAYGTEALDSRISFASSWIQGTTGIAPVPEPDSAMMVTFGVAMVAAMVRRRT